MNNKLQEWGKNLYCLAGYTYSERSGLIHQAKAVLKVIGKERIPVTDPEEIFYVITCLNSDLIRGGIIRTQANGDQYIFNC